MLKTKSKNAYKLRNHTAEQPNSVYRQEKITMDNRQQTTHSQQFMTKSVGGIVVRCVITAILIALSCWLLNQNWQMRLIRYENYSFTAEEAKKLKNYPHAQYAYGMKTWSRTDVQKASNFFQQAVSEDPFYMDAWLRLAESEAALGRTEKSKKILIFTDDLASDVFRWQWPQMLLARDLKMNDIFLKNANYLLGQRKLTQDTLHLLDHHYDSDTAALLDVLKSDNLVPYLKWLVRWGRIDETKKVWQRIVEESKPDTKVVLQYTHFLVEQKQVRAAQEVWKQHNDVTGMTNAGFEMAITQRGFDWRYREDKKENWEISRINSEISDESHVLRIWFAGEENIAFLHLYQIVPVNPLQPYRLSYRWKSKWITTDQGPFVEIYGYDQEGFRHKGPMITGTNLWHTESLEFTPPEDCNAVVVRVRRMKSRRFDSKIAGTLWLDDFKLEKIDQGSRLNVESDPRITQIRSTNYDSQIQ
jgi:tetratricopeptide (TPR) repeat protein